MAKQLSVRINDEIEEMMEAEKEKYPYDVSDSEIVRTALTEYLSGNSKTNQATAQTAD